MFNIKSKLLKAKQKGLTAIEISIFVVVFIILAGMAFGVYQVFDSSNRISSSAKNLQSLGGGLQNAFSSQGDYTGVNAQVAINLGIPDRSMISGTTLRNAWQGSVTIASAGGSSADITFANVARNECAKFVNTSESLFHRITVGGTAVKDFQAGSPLGTVALANACSSGAGAVTTIVFTLGL
ncbi:MAG: hypothetical protein IBX55_01555 [Methyloprofundus sp.]|nr:hypothetical protein [Methyloprofundus sp.]